MTDLARGERLREDRRLLGLNQTEFAALARVSKRAQIRYEQGDAPDADYLAAIADAGCDVLFILTGHRPPGAIVLPPELRRLLDDYEACASADQDAIGRLVTTAAHSATRAKPPRQSD